jgi:small-conductance mechanosensitive channel
LNGGDEILFQGPSLDWRMATAAGVVPLATNATAADPYWGVLPPWVPAWSINVVESAFVMLLAWATSRLAIRMFGRRLAQRFERPSLTRTAIRGIRTMFFLGGLIVVLNIWGLALGDIALSVTVFSAVVGVILAPIVGSIISGVFLLADQPYEIGDMIQLDENGTRGYVEDITLRYTKIFTLDNTFLVIPNGTIRERDVYNFSAEDPRTRLSLDVLVTYESDVPLAQRRIQQAARDVEGVIEGGPSIRVGASRYQAAPECLVDNFADHGVLLRLRFWIRTPYHIPRIRSAVQENVWDAMAADNVEFAYPHTHLYFDETSGDLTVRGRGGTDSSRRPQVRSNRPPGRRDAVDDVPDEERNAGGRD